MADTRTEQVERDGWTFDVEVGGPADAPVVLLLHGFPQDRGCWDDVSRGLRAEGLRTVAFDQRGYSPGARPGQVVAYRMEELVADAVAVLDHVGAEQAHVVGHDWGGAVAWAMAARVPDRVATLTALSTPHPVALARSMTRSTQPLKSWYVLLFRSGFAERAMAPRLPQLLRRMGLPADEADRHARRMAEPSALTGALNWYRAISLAGGGSVDSSGSTTVRVPTTYVWGRRDPALGRWAAEATADHVAADYRFVELDAGHWLPERHAAAVQREVLARVTGDDASPTR